VVAGFRRGWLDTVVMTLADAQLAFPFILLAIGIIAVLGPSFPTLILVIGLSGWVSYARVLRAQVLGLRTREFVDAVQALGGSAVRVVLRHIVPNILSSLIVIATLELARAIVLEATLSFLGLGIQPPTPSWGGMIYEGREYLDSAWWISTWPGLVLMATSLVVSRTGDWLRDLRRIEQVAQPVPRAAGDVAGRQPHGGLVGRPGGCDGAGRGGGAGRLGGRGGGSCGWRRRWSSAARGTGCATCSIRRCVESERVGSPGASWPER